MEKVKNITFDKVAMLISLIYIILPVSIFCFGWLKIYFAIPTVAMLLYFGYKAFSTFAKENVCLVTCKDCHFWGFVVILTFVWVYFSGIGGLTYQNSDFWARNPMYWDLCDYSWPVIFDLSKESEAVQSIAGSKDVAFSYYFSWWLVPALISKIFGFGKIGRELLLYLHAVLGVLCVMYCLVRYFRKKSLIIPIVMVLFSGIDIVGYLIVYHSFPMSITSHIEWWSGYFQLSSNTTLLFWVFNQSIPLWLIVILMLQVNNENILGLISLSFAYSPWATIGLVPIALSKCVGKGKDTFVRVVKEFVSLSNVSVGLIMLGVYGLFYTCGQSSSGQTGLIFSLFQNKWNVLYMLLCFWICDIFIFFFVMGKYIRKYELYYIIIAEFLIIPLFRVIQYSWLIRGLIPASFILMIYCIRFLMEKSHDKEFRIRKRILIIVLIIGTVTPAMELVRCINLVARNDVKRDETVYSFGDIHDEGLGNVAEIKDIYFKYDYNDSLFFKYLAR